MKAIPRRWRAGATNAKWFNERLAERDLSQFSLAKLLKIQRASLNRVIHGKRRLQLTEATAIANALQVPLEEVLAHVGVRDAAAAPGIHKVPVVGWVDGGLNCHMEPPKGDKTVAWPGGESVSRTLPVAVRFQTSSTKRDGLDGALAFFFNNDSGTGPDLFGHLCVVRLAKNAGTLLRVVRRGYSTNAYNLTDMNGELMEENVFIAGASPVLWLKF